MRKFRDTNTGEIITEEELRKEFEKLKKETPEEYDHSFNQYLFNCTSKNGMLIEITNEDKNIKNEKENRTMKTYGKKIEIINDVDEICEGMSPACYDERQNNEGSVKYTWKDIVLINGKCYAEEFEISGLMDGDDVYQIDSFLEAVAEKYGVDVDDVQTYMMNDIHFDPKNLPWGAAECGCYIGGKAEWL